MQRRGGSFFGRRKGKQLRPGQRKALETVLPRLLIDLGRPPPKNLAALFDVPTSAFRLEIGFGGGEHLLHEAKAHPEIGFIGVEPFENGVAKAVTAIARDAIRNVRLYDQDATALLNWLPARSLERIDLLYPDPWPKKRHWKRRFVNAENLDRIARCLALGGIFRFATDVESYAEWTLEAVARNARLALVDDASSDHSQPWPDWPGTRYEAKAIKAGRRAAYLTFCRT
ncbi:MAG: tRNA (guanosine(46)-N7)-methyltransferase TrmB [Propylenella sp.]